MILVKAHELIHLWTTYVVMELSKRGAHKENGKRMADSDDRSPEGGWASSPSLSGRCVEPFMAMEKLN
jgi:hypothetical protein